MRDDHTSYAVPADLSLKKASKFGSKVRRAGNYDGITTDDYAGRKGQSRTAQERVKESAHVLRCFAYV